MDKWKAEGYITANIPVSVIVEHNEKSDALDEAEDLFSRGDCKLDLDSLEVVLFEVVFIERTDEDE